LIGLRTLRKIGFGRSEALVHRFHVAAEHLRLGAARWKPSNPCTIFIRWLDSL